MRHDRPHAATRRFAVSAALAAITAVTAACAGKEGAGGDSAGAAAGDSGAPATAAATTPAPAAHDTGMAGMDHSQMAGMGATNRSAPKDSNQAFLRMMSDHHEGVVVMSDSAQPRLQSATAKADARKVREKQESEQQRMLGMLSRQYQDSVTPMIMPSNRAMIDSVTRAAQGAEADRVYYRQVIAHHREGMRHAEMHLPHLTGEAKQMAQKSIADQRREIQEFERKAQGGARSGT